ncbi:MAG: ACP S-malonyltransferase [Planctomycetaceae bacterium]|nr:ACP S-malonyltransferase [Planctomycetaceae bacterium]
MSRTALLFPGQGAQHVGMGRRMAEQYPRVREMYEQAGQILGFDLARLCFDGPAEKLDSTDISQPALFVTSLAALEKLRTDSPGVAESCEMTAGLSLGEYTALVFADAMSFEDGLRVVQRRGQAMQAAAEATPSGMVSILLLDREKVEEICEQASETGRVRIANYLCPGNLVVSGEKAGCERAAELAGEAGGRAIPLAVAGAFHTEIMSPADQSLADALAGVRISSPRIPVISNVDARPHSDPEEIRQLLVQQVINPVRWEDSMNYLLAEGCSDFYEVGPGKVLKGLLKRISRKTACNTVNDSFDDTAGI